jgi:proline iminopeptidase
MLPLIVTFLYASCRGASASQRFPEASAPGSEEGFVDAGRGVHLFYRVVGTGHDTVVVLHGGPGFSMSYIALDLEPLTDRRTLLFYDQRGSGRSTVVADSASLDAQRFAEDLEAVRRHFGLRRLTLLAHSWGAAVAALYAARYPERIGRLLIVDPISPSRTYFVEARQRLDARRDSAARRRLHELQRLRLSNPGDAATCRAYYKVFFSAHFSDTAAMRRSRGDFCAGTPEAIRNKLEGLDRFTVQSLGDWDWRPALRAVTAPALVIHGTADFIPAESSRAWAAAFPNGRLLLLEASGHFPYLEAPEQFFAAADAFLDGRWPAGAEALIRSGSR